ncbi:BTAD domain-containing putative transcriptional regulator [Streptomyces sp. AC512_CC834]|uniref:AfsR/SARP family transcriptional regulator n=1 Tax=Streptomyces sp. AC512_CC834 TaxID=2823691 RepID=UPI0035AD83A8
MGRGAAEERRQERADLRPPAPTAPGDPERVIRQDQGYLLRAGPGELDAARFEDLADRARASAAGDPGRSRRLFDEALGLWRGPAFAGITYVPALASEAARLDELRLGLLEDRIDVDLWLGRHNGLLGEL